MPTIDDNRLRIESNLGGGIMMPNYPGYYYIEVILYDLGAELDAFLYEFYVNPATMLGSVNNISDDIKQKTLYEIIFTPLIDIPQGTVPLLPSTPWGTVDIVFPTMNTNL